MDKETIEWLFAVYIKETLGDPELHNDDRYLLGIEHARNVIMNAFPPVSIASQLAESEQRAQLLAETLEAINERDRWRNVETEQPTVGEKYECRNPIWDFPGARQYTYSKEGFGFVNIHNVFVLPVNIAQPTIYRQRRPNA